MDQFHISKAELEAELKATEGVVIVTDTLYQFMMSAIKAIPDKKQQKWKHHLKDKKGTNTRCKYENGKIYNWSLQYHTFVEVRSNKQGGDDAFVVPISPVGEAFQFGDKHGEAAMSRAIKANYTGHHHRNHHVVVPAHAYGSARK